MSSFVALETMGHTRRPFVAGRGHRRVWWVLLFFRGLLLSFLGGGGHLMGGCRPSWAAGIICGGGTCVTFHGGDVVAGQMWVGFGRWVDVMGDSCWYVVVVG